MTKIETDEARDRLAQLRLVIAASIAKKNTSELSYRWVVARGASIVCGVPAEEQGDLPVDVARAAVDVVGNRCDRGVELARTLVDRRASAEGAKADEMCLDLITLREEVWEATVCLADYSDDLLPFVDDDNLRNEFDEAWFEVGAKIDEFDNACRKQAQILRVVSRHERLAQWKKGLVGDYRELFVPWWLESTRESSADVTMSKPAADPTYPPTGWPAEIPRMCLVAGPETPGGESSFPASWLSPVGDLRARMYIPAAPRDRDAILHIEGEGMERLVNAEINLCGLQTNLSADGRAKFSWRALREGPGPLWRLVIDGLEWTPDVKAV